MKKLFIALLLLFAFSGNAVAAKPVSTGTIDLVTVNPEFGHYAQFNITVDKKYDCLGKAGCARVNIFCYQDGSLVYGEGGSIYAARNFGGDPADPNAFILGGGSSIWVSNGGGPAECDANLFRFDYSGPIEQYVQFDTVHFSAGG